MPAIYLKSASARHALVLQSILSSLPLDYYARLKVATNHLTQGILESLPIPSISRVDEFARSVGVPQFVDWRAFELTYTAWDLESFAADFGLRDRRFDGTMIGDSSYVANSMPFTHMLMTSRARTPPTYSIASRASAARTKLPTASTAPSA